MLEVGSCGSVFVSYSGCILEVYNILRSVTRDVDGEEVAHVSTYMTDELFLGQPFFLARLIHHPDPDPEKGVYAPARRFSRLESVLLFYFPTKRRKKKKDMCIGACISIHR